MLTMPAIGQPAKETPFKLPSPKGWAKETIPLPPSFAKNMTWKGTEELRFAPGMFKADAVDFFSYALLFWLPDDQKIDTKTMEKELLEYYRGLAKAVLEGKKTEVDLSTFTLTIKDAKEKPGKRAGGEEVTAYDAELKWTEPFATNCVFVCASPQVETAEVWKQLREIRSGCTTP
jgi:hypothetical protein